MADPAQEELLGLLSEEKTESAPQEAPQAVEEIEYYLGGKGSKLPINAEFAFTENGKTSKAPLSTILNHYRQRSNLDRESKEFKTARESWENERKAFEQRFGNNPELLEQALQVQKWSLENGEAFNKIWEAVQSGTTDKMVAIQDANPELAAELQGLRKELQELRGFKQTFEQRQEEAENEEAAKEVRAEAEEWQKAYPEFKLDDKDENGQDLYSRILLHGVENHIPKFSLAAQDFLGTKLTDALLSRARQDAVKGIKQEKQQGIVSRSSTPQSGKGPEVDPTKMSWSEANNAAKAELAELLG